MTLPCSPVATRVDDSAIFYPGKYIQKHKSGTSRPKLAAKLSLYLPFPAQN